MNIFYYTHTLNIRPHGKVFDGPSSVFDTQRILRIIVGNTLLLAELTCLNLDLPCIVDLQIQTYCKVGICFALTEIYPTYIAGLLGSYYYANFLIRNFYIIRKPAIFAPLFRKACTLQIQSFDFRLADAQEFENFLDYSTCEITYENVSLPFRIVLDVATKIVGLVLA